MIWGTPFPKATPFTNMTPCAKPTLATNIPMADANGDFYVTGNFYGTLDFGGGPLTSAGGYDIFVAKFSSAGSHLWSKRFGSPKLSAVVTEWGSGIGWDPTDNTVVVTGMFDGT